MTAFLKVPTMLLLSAALLAACGGGGSSGGPAPGAPDVPVAPVAQRSVNGVAAKGIVKKARVQLFALDAQGNKGSAPLASTVTGDDGSYSVKIATTVLNFVIEVDAASGASMADEASGQDVEFPAGLKLRTLVQLAAADETAVTSHVSPLTEMVARTAERASGGLSAANIAQAKTGVIAALGFDPEKTRPVNSNSAAAASATPEERMQSLTLAAISTLAQDKQLGCAQAAISARIACVVQNVSQSAALNGDKLTLDEAIRAGLRDALVNVAANTTINHTGMGSVTGFPAFSQSVVPTTPGALTGVAAAKKLFTSLRTNLQAWSDSTKQGGKLATQYDSVRADFDKATAPVDASLLVWVKMAENGLDLLADFKAGTSNSGFRGLAFPTGAWGGCTVYSDAAATVKATSAANALTVSCNVTNLGNPIVTNGRIYADVYPGSDIVMTPIAGEAGKFSYAARAVKAVRSFMNGDHTVTTYVGNYGSAADARATGTIAYTKSGNNVASVNISGMMPARINDDGAVLTDYEMWTLSALRTPLGENEINYSFSGQVTAYLGGVSVGKFILNEGSFMRTVEDHHDAVDDLVKEARLAVTAQSGHSSVSGALRFANFQAAKNGGRYLPTQVEFTGSIASADGQFFAGTLSLGATYYAAFDSAAPVSASNFVKRTAALSGTVTVPNRPKLLLNYTTSSESPTLVKQFAQYNDGSVVFNASWVRDGDAADVIRLASSEGVTVELNGADTVDVKRDNVKVAVLNLKTGVINYADGAFESLK